MTDQQPIVYLVDDDKDIRKSLSRALSKRGYVVEDFESAKAFLATYEPRNPGCLVLDHGMPDMTGLELQEVLIDQEIHIPIIFITGHGGVPESVKAIKSGAIDFLQKPFKQDILIERINNAFEIDAQSREGDNLQADIKARFGRLTEREREIANLMINQPSEASSKMIARTLDISPRTVDHHRARILEKMDARSVAELLDLANKAGLSH